MTALTFAAARAMAEWADEPDRCCVCGGEPTHLGLLVVKTETGLLAAVAWCNRTQDCIDDAKVSVETGTAIVRPISS